MVEQLKENQVFVFGSNLYGNHAGGAAKFAFEKCGAIFGKGVGIQNQSYAIPTLDGNFKKLDKVIIMLYLQDFADYAKSHQEKEFLLTPIGTGIAGFTLDES